MTPSAFIVAGNIGDDDKIETLAIKAVFGNHINDLCISSSKSMTGHLLGAAGGIEAIASILTINNNIIPPTIHYESPDPECDLNYVPKIAVEHEVHYSMSNSFGFGGHNAVLIFKSYSA